MKKSITLSFIIFLSIITSNILSAAIPSTPTEPTFRPAAVFSDNMVLQQQRSVKIWGWGDNGANVTVKPSWSATPYRTTVNAQGQWSLSIQTPSEGGPFSLTLTESMGGRKDSQGKKVVTIHDVLCGEVWICSGQSNMDEPVRGYGNQIVEGSIETAMAAPKYADKVRIFKVNEDTTNVTLDDCKDVWKKASGESASETSAIAYNFAVQVSDYLGVPVGIIVNAWGGSNIESWLPMHSIERALKGKISQQRYNEVISRPNPHYGSPSKVGTLYNGRVYPIRGFAAKGFLWYQGCSNLDDFTYYDKLQTELARVLRADWGDTDFQMPFMFVTLAPFSWGDSNGLKRPYLVESQLRTLTTIPNCYNAVTETLGDEKCIHPSRKRPVAQQLAMLALDHTYHQNLGFPSGYPFPDKIEYDGRKVSVHFSNVPNGLGVLTSPSVKGFELSGSDHVFHKASAVIRNGQWVDVQCDEVTEPVAVRYAFHNYTDADLVNSFGVPVPSFRSDDWPAK